MTQTKQLVLLVSQVAKDADIDVEQAFSFIIQRLVKNIASKLEECKYYCKLLNIFLIIYNLVKDVDITYLLAQTQKLIIQDLLLNIYKNLEKFSRSTILESNTAKFVSYSYLTSISSNYYNRKLSHLQLEIVIQLK